VGEVVVIGFDSGKLQLDAIKSGLMAGAITQNPVGIGYEAVKAAVMAIRGEPLEPVIDTGYYWFDLNSINSSIIAPLLYE
ncbi:MAG TPA: substrate-binding domain-containing protein, partial [Firmicutes bacterium]|nr:substrate-binding domain-containing protein [Bacillota bacterium]